MQATTNRRKVISQALNLIAFQILWFGFALTIHHSMKFFRELPIAGPLMVALFGPIIYLEGEKLDAVIIVDYFLLTLIISAWILLFHLFRTIFLRFDDQLSIHTIIPEQWVDQSQSNTLNEYTPHD